MSHARGFAATSGIAPPPFLPALLFAMLLAQGCVVETGIGIRLEMEAGSTEPAKITVRVFAGDCPGRADALVLDEVGSRVVVADQTFAPGGARPVGELDPGRYCFAALARGDDCRPLAYGERSVSVGRDPEIVVRMAPLSWMAAWCPAASTCAAGECTGGPPPTECTPDTCRTGMGSGGTCCTGACVDLASSQSHCGACDAACTDAERCIGGACRVEASCGGVDLTSDRLHCGECAHACLPDLDCVAGLCRPSPRPAQTTVLVDARLATPETRTDLRVGIAWVDACDAGTERPRWLAAGATARLGGSADGVLTATLHFADSGGSAGSGSCTDTGALPVAFGHIAVFQDTNGDGGFDQPEHDAPRELGLADHAVIFSEMEVGRSLPAELALLFPEGLLSGTALYRAEADAFYPVGGDPSGSTGVRIAGACLADTDGGAADPACLSGQTGPFRP